jgi:hypothetical protein
MDGRRISYISRQWASGSASGRSPTALSLAAVFLSASHSLTNQSHLRLAN